MKPTWATPRLQTFQPSRFSWESSFFWCILLVTQFLSKSPGFWNNSKINVQVIETHVGFSDACGNGLINLSFNPKPKLFFDRGWQSVSFCNSLPHSSCRGPSSCPVVLQEIVVIVHWGMPQWKPPCFQTPEIGMCEIKHPLQKEICENVLVLDVKDACSKN